MEFRRVHFRSFAVKTSPLDFGTKFTHQLLVMEAAMADQVRLSDPHGILQEFNPDGPKMVAAKPDIESDLSRIADRVAKASYLEPYFFHPDPAVQARAAAASVSVDVGKLGD